ncbi:hypothetical protein diail_6828 [Diaporthe ilicicola]|nr:hypothetical protein diail_6828 [Diaporthe ilicicola]
MEEEERTTHAGRKGSRGVSNESSYGVGQESSGLPHPDPLFPAAAEESGHVRISSSPHPPPPPLDDAVDDIPGSAEKQNDSMDGDLAARHWGYGGVMTTSRSTTPFFGHRYGVADNLVDMYDSGVDFNALSVVGRGLPAQQHLGLDSTRQPQSRSMTPTKLASNFSLHGRQTSFENRVPIARYAQSTPAELEAVAIDPSGDGYYQEHRTSLPTEETGDGSQAGSSRYSLSRSSSPRRSLTRNIAIPAETNRQSPTGAMGAYHSQTSISNNPFSPSSYPPTSPLLPPPPLTDYPFDPDAIMFPGAGAVDGGVRVVYAEHDHGHEDNEPRSAHGEAAGSFSNCGSSWTRHTRVYGGGGVCLACAAAGGGGFYGARVRPEDKR